MKKIVSYIFILYTSSIFACGGGEWEGMSFYNLFMQTNISAEEFYPFLRDEYNDFYAENYFYDKNKELLYPKGNVLLWQEILSNWSINDIRKAVYKEGFNWSTHNSVIEKKSKLYIDFAKECSDLFNYRYQTNSWDYDEVTQKPKINTQELLNKANLLLKNTNNEQLKARYYYQIIRILHYTQDWQDAVNFFENKVENKLPKNEIYYYILDQVAGCYFSTNKFEKSAYFFTKVFNKSIDRKKSAYSSYNFCTFHNAEGKPFFNGIEDEKDLLLISSLRDFSDEINNLKKFISLDANDKRVELLFMRALSNVERSVWNFEEYEHQKEFPYLKGTTSYKHLLKISEEQIANSNVKNIDFWTITNSYLSFINGDIETAKNKLSKVNSFKAQKKILEYTYEVFTWKTITPENENYLYKILTDSPENKTTTIWNKESEGDWRKLILEKVAHVYLVNNQLAKAFLVHNKISTVNNIQSIELLDVLESFYYKKNKSDYEQLLLKGNTTKKASFIDYINYQKGIYYIYQKEPKTALKHFIESNYKGQKIISGAVFSNNIKECFECPQDNIMQDEVYKASVFDFIQKTFDREDLSYNLLALEKLRFDEKKWKQKLANYLLGNFYYNISNTGYFRGLLTDNTNCCNYTYLNTSGYGYYNNNEKYRDASEIITSKSRYNLQNVGFYEKHFFNLSETAYKYYQQTIDLSTDKELNARCLFLMAKCELNIFYNEDESINTFEVKVDNGYGGYYKLVLPQYKSFKILKEDYSDTQFHNMIIHECSYFKLYSSRL